MLSIIIPVHNEGENILPLLQETKDVMKGVGKEWEIIVVDDASTDDTWEKLTKVQAIPLRCLKLKKQSGQTSGLAAGFTFAKGNIFITLDGDGQNDPHDIPRLLETLTCCDCVCGYREQRHDSWQKRIISKAANAVRRLILGDDIIDTGCSLKAFRKECLENICLFKGAHRFLASLILMGGFSVKQIPVSHRPRTKGKSHYSLFNRGPSLLTDLFAVRWLKRRHITVQVEEEFP